MNKVLFFTLGVLGLLSSCSIINKGSGLPENSITLDTLVVTPMSGVYAYQPSREKVVDLLHTRLEVKFDWEKQYLYGKAWLDFKPYFYATDHFLIDAKGFDINEISYQGSSLKYDYDGQKINVHLPREFTRKDTFQLFIEYTAKPNELEVGGSKAITSDKGLYFINPLGKEEGKPQQIWTQGETEASSCWFPTIDAPNEKTTMEIAIRVQNKFKTLSNGILVLSEDNGDGTRTDIWEQDKPHAPYLFMMTVGEYALVQDTWRDSIDVNYYVEPKYEEDAREIFNHTPEMLEFFSGLIGYDYPWDKYSQIIVRDYVSGAMENTSAVIFGEFVQKNHRELIDDGNEDIVAHEMFHHWFGDLVTCESWSNLPLNESFATYSEYLWREHKHGRDNADYHLNSELIQYLTEFNSGKAEDMIRFYYDDKEDMFDSHSYAKGSRILHMLRYHIGDEAFFEGLKKYLHDNEYEAAEIHHLRLAFEEVTGQDLNWFFNQWFLDKGHPVLEFNYEYNDSTKMQTIQVAQLQDITEFPVYQLPVQVDIYTSKGVQRHEVLIDSIQKSFSFKVDEEPRLVNVDAEKILLATVTDNRSIEQFIYQYRNAPLFMDRWMAQGEAIRYARKNTDAFAVVLASLEDKSWAIRARAVNKVEMLMGIDDDKMVALLSKRAKEDVNSNVRAAALTKLTEYYTDVVSPQLFKDQIANDSSYIVISTALEGLAVVSEKEGLRMAHEFEEDNNKDILLSVASIYSEYPKRDQEAFMLGLKNKVTGYHRMAYISFLGDYLVSLNDPKISDKGLVYFAEIAGANNVAWYEKFYAIDAMKAIKASYIQQKNALEKEIQSFERSGDSGKAQMLSVEVQSLEGRIQQIERQMGELKSKEKDKRVLQFLD